MDDFDVSSVTELLNQTMWLHGILMVIGIVILVFLGWLTRDSEKVPIHLIALTVCLGYLLFTDVIPLIDDYVNKSIIIAEGTYVNTSPINTPRSSAGILQVKLYTDGEELLLHTIGGDFPQSGEHYVRAYYTPKSKYLLYIEILNEG